MLNSSINTSACPTCSDRDRECLDRAIRRQYFINNNYHYIVATFVPEIHLQLDLCTTVSSLVRINIFNANGLVLISANRTLRLVCLVVSDQFEKLTVYYAVVVQV